ncbi:MAG: prepilin peptidase [Desulfurivibrionaceae bacterium]
MRAGVALCRYGTGLLAAAAALVLLYQGRESSPLVFVSLFLLVITITDTFYTRVPNIINLILIITGFGFHAFSNGAAGVLIGLGGLLTGLALLLPGYLFRMLGAGDVKAMAALGTITGPAAVFQVFLYTSLIGGGIAAAYYLASRNILQTLKNGVGSLQKYAYTRDRYFLKPAPSNIRLPYAAAIALGYFAFINWGKII